jgi:26S proteasome non-ATPase regulatory subunit 9
LKTDYKTLSDDMEKSLFELHAILKKKDEVAPPNVTGTTVSTTTSTTSTATPPSSSTPPPSSTNVPPSTTTFAGTAPSSMSSDVPMTDAPFAVVDDVSANSPASAAGLKVGDQLVQYGDVRRSGNGANDLRAVTELTMRKIGQPIGVSVIRSQQTLSLSLTPQKWSGKGLLGCHIAPLK